MLLKNVKGGKEFGNISELCLVVDGIELVVFETKCGISFLCNKEVVLTSCCVGVIKK